MPLETTIAVRLVDASSGIPIGLKEVHALTVQVSGDDAAKVTDTAGLPAPAIETTDGSAVFTLAEGIVPDTDDPVDFTVLVTGEGFVPTSQPVRLFQTGDHTVTINVASLSDPPAGVSSAFYVEGSAGAYGFLEADLRIDTPPDEGTGASASVDIEKGTVLLGEGGVPLAGDLSVSVTYFTNQETASLSSFPGGFGVSLAQNEAGEFEPDAAFITGGFVAIEITDELGEKAETFEDASGNPKPIQVTTSVPGETVNPETGEPLGDGDTIPIWSYDEETGEWTYEATATVSGPDENGNFLAAFEAAHLSYWNLDWSFPGCNVDIALDRAPNAVGVPVYVRAQRLVGGFFNTNYHYTRDNLVHVVGVPQSISLRFDVLFGNEVLGATDVMLGPSCAPFSIPVAAPTIPVVDVKLQIEGKCTDGGEKFPIPAFNYSIYNHSLGKTVALGTGSDGQAFVENVPAGSSVVTFWPLGAKLGLWPLTLYGVPIASDPTAVNAVYAFDCKTGEAANVRILSFSALPNVVSPGGQSVLSWTTRYAASCAVNGMSVPGNGSLAVTPSESMYYWLTCQGQGGPVSVAQYVKVAAPVEIQSFMAIPAILLYGEKTTLWWDASNATTCSLTDHGWVWAQGAVQKQPLATTLYTLTCQGDQGPASEQVLVTVLHPPRIEDDVAHTLEDRAVEIPVLENDFDEDGEDLSIVSITQPDNGIVTQEDDGLLCYVPNPDFFGEDSFSYTARDPNGLTDVAAVTVSVFPVNDFPGAEFSGTQTAIEGSLTPHLILTGTDVEDLAESLVVTVFRGPFHGSLSTLSGNAPLKVFYTPIPGYSGGDSFEFTVTDSEGTVSAARAVSLQAYSRGDIPVAVPVLGMVVEEDSSVEITLTGMDAQDLENSLTVSVVSGPLIGSLDILSGTAPLQAIYTPPPDFSGNDSFEFTVTDTDSLVSVRETVSVRVLSVNDLPVAVPHVPVSLVQGGSAILSLTGTDVEDPAGGLAVAVVAGPIHGFLNGTHGAAPFPIVYTPNTDYAGSDAIEFIVTDSEGGSSAPRSVSISILPNTQPFRLAYRSAPPVIVEAGETWPSITVEIQNVNGNQIPTATSCVTISVDGPAFLSGTTTRCASGGIVVFDDLSCDKAGDALVGIASEALFSAPSVLVIVEPGPPAKLLWGIPPPASVLAGATWTQAITVLAQDAFGNLAINDNSTIVTLSTLGSAALKSTINDFNETLAGGIATFEYAEHYFSYPKAEEMFLVASAPGVLSSDLAPVEVSAGPPDKVGFLTPVRTSTAGACSEVITVQAQDRFGNPAVMDCDLSFRVQVAAGVVAYRDPDCTDPLSATSSSGQIVIPEEDGRSGTASFYLSATTTGTKAVNVSKDFSLGFMVRYTYTIWGTQGLIVLPAAPARLGWKIPPPPVVQAGATWGFQAVVQDAFGNMAAASNEWMDVILSSGTGFLDGPASVQSVNGVAAFSGLSYDVSETISFDLVSGTLEPLLDRPLRVVASGGVAGIGVGEKHACALFPQGQVKCWGGNGYGQLGVGDSLSRGDQAGEMGVNLPPVNLGTNAAATAVAAGRNHSCALLLTGKVKCWGYNNAGQLGNLYFVASLIHAYIYDRVGDSELFLGDSLKAIQFEQDLPVLALASDASADHSCAVLSGGKVGCWGANDSGQLGLGNLNSTYALVPLPVTDMGPDAVAISVAIGRAHSCALLSTGHVKCWGDNQFGQLGLGNTTDLGAEPGEMGANLPAVDLGPDVTAAALFAGGDNTCVILDTGALKCWGANNFGQLGSGNTQAWGDNAGESPAALPPIDLGPEVFAVQVAPGSTTCAIFDGGTLKCWGRGSAAGLGLGSGVNLGDGPGEMGESLAPVDLGAGRVVAQIDGGSQIPGPGSVCAILDPGLVKCWGANSNGQLGLGYSSVVPLGSSSGQMGGDLPPLDLVLPDGGVAFKLAIAGDTGQSVPVYTCSGSTVLEVHDNQDVPVMAPADVTVDLMGPPEVSFYSDPACTQLISQLTLPEGTATSVFYFKGTDVGLFQLDVLDDSGYFLPISQMHGFIPGPPDHLAFKVPPAESEFAGIAWSPFSVQVEDPYGNLVTDYLEEVSLSLAAASGVLTATPAVPVGGAVTFANVVYDRAENISITVEGSGVPRGLLNVPVAVEPLPVPHHLAFGVLPSPVEWSGQPFSFFIVEVRAQDETVVWLDDSTVVSLRVAGGTETLSGTTTQTVDAGVAVFGDISYDAVEPISLWAEAPGVAPTLLYSMDVRTDLAPGWSIEWVSPNAWGVSADKFTSVHGPVLSGDGRFVAY
ncbi:MAG: tandem-95 repeat protein, partial [Bdellovibrionota bacterium]